MIDKMNYIRVGESVFPYICTIGVLAEYQDEYGSIENWKKKVIGYNADTNEIQESDMKGLHWSFKKMFEAGHALAVRKGEETVKPSDEDIDEILSYIGIRKSGILAMEELVRCINGREKKQEAMVNQEK